jgi:hypothetical protein
MSRFASITAELLARKGEAKPWNGVEPEFSKKPLAWEKPPIAERPTPDVHKCTLRINRHDFERLGILAVKQGKTRHRLLQEAVERLLTKMTEDYGPGCRCLGAANTAEFVISPR